MVGGGGNFIEITSHFLDTASRKWAQIKTRIQLKRTVFPNRQWPLTKISFLNVVKSAVLCAAHVQLSVHALPPPHTPRAKLWIPLFCRLTPPCIRTRVRRGWEVREGSWGWVWGLGVDRSARQLLASIRKSSFLLVAFTCIICTCVHKYCIIIFMYVFVYSVVQSGTFSLASEAVLIGSFGEFLRNSLYNRKKRGEKY